MREHLRRFRALEPAARGIFVRAALLLPLVHVSLRLRGFRATQTSLQRSVPDSTKTPDAVAADVAALLQAAKRIARMVRAAARYLWQSSTCLESSLALWWLLARQGIEAEIRIGARKIAGKFEAHAWVEVGGVALNEAEHVHRHYTVFEAEFSSLPEAG